MIWRLHLIETTSPGSIFQLVKKKKKNKRQRKIYKIHYDDISSVFAQLEVED